MGYQAALRADRHQDDGSRSHVSIWQVHTEHLQHAECCAWPGHRAERLASYGALSYLWSQSCLRHLDARLSDVCKANPFPSQVSSPLLVFTAHLQPLHLFYVFLFSVPPIANYKLYSVFSILFLVNLPSLNPEHKYLYCFVSTSFTTQTSAWLIQSIR